MGVAAWGWYTADDCFKHRLNIDIILAEMQITSAGSPPTNSSTSRISSDVQLVRIDLVDDGNDF